MIRPLLFIVFLVAVYLILKAVLRSTVRGYQDDARKRRQGRLMGEEMVQDPQCRTYIPKGRAVARRIDGKNHFFCSEACAKQYEEKTRA